jgi:succinoglycan biosynthesis transport protein ExoP
VATADVYRTLWRHRFFIVLLTAMLVAGAWYFTSQQTPIYRASTLVRIQQEVTDPGQVFGSLAASERLAQTYAEIVDTGSLRNEIESELAGELTRDEIAEVDVTGEPVRDLDLLWIRASSPSPERARLVANAAPSALLEFVDNTGTLRDNVVTIRPAGLPTEPASPNMTLNIAIALLLGLIFNGLLALLIELLSDRMPEPEELESTVGLPVLATIPTLTFGGRERPAEHERPRDEGDVDERASAEAGRIRSMRVG